MLGVENMTFGSKSRCIRSIVHMSQVETVRCLGLGCNSLPGCLKVECDFVNLEVKIFTPAGATPAFHTCTEAETNAYKGFSMDVGGGVQSVGTFILCPNYSVVCNRGLYCPDDCNMNGRCLKNGSCWCYYGWKGASCSERIASD